jgi:hypothetical protein
MLSLIFTTCLLADSSHCAKRSSPIYDQISPAQCMMVAQPELALWSDEHPGWFIKDWRCEYIRDAKA